MNKISQMPEPESSLIKTRGDVITFRIAVPPSMKGAAWLRTNIGRAEIRRMEIIERWENEKPVLARDWTDIPMQPSGENSYETTLPLLQTGRFEAKPFFMQEGSAKPVWPEGKNTVIKVEPWQYSCANMIYTAFVRQFGKDRFKSDKRKAREPMLADLEKEGYAVIPRSGTFRDLRDQLDFIMDELGFRIIQLLPVHPCPTTYARMGRFGSPYAALDFMNVDPALAEFDKKTTPLDQFRELTDAVHKHMGRLLLDIPVNHTGWGSSLQIAHPEWFARNHDNSFQSPGAWGVTWEDLAELDYSKRGLWRYMADVFLFWCARGVDGFRCDAGYMIPFDVWEYIIAKVRHEYPDTMFLLEGLGGKIEVMEKLLGDANLNWAYSELFQNYNRNEVENYLSGWNRISSAKGNLVHYAETHDNNRMASVSKTYAMMRTALSALFSKDGAFGITAGVEWFADEKVDVHGAPSLSWENKENQVALIKQINSVLKNHPAFMHKAELSLIHTGPGSGVALKRVGKKSALLALVNLDANSPTCVYWNRNLHPFATDKATDLLTGQSETIHGEGGNFLFNLEPGGFRCLSAEPFGEMKTPENPLLSGALTCKALEIYDFLGNRNKLPDNFESMRDELTDNPADFCKKASNGKFTHIVSWHWPRDTKREIMLPPDSFLMIVCQHMFTAELVETETTVAREESLPDRHGAHFALFLPLTRKEKVRRLFVKMTVHTPDKTNHSMTPAMLLTKPGNNPVKTKFTHQEIQEHGIYGLCANDRGAMAQVNAAWGTIRSQYDAVLAANLNQDHPVNRRVMFTRCRAWLVYKGYSHEINQDSLTQFSTVNNRQLQWEFDAPCGMGKTVPVTIKLRMDQNSNFVSLIFTRNRHGKNPDTLADSEPVKIILRPDIEDRDFHCKTKAFTGPETTWSGAVENHETGFEFSPSGAHALEMSVAGGTFTLEPEWLYMVGHPLDAERGLDGSSDLFSPGWFSLELTGETSATLNAAVTSRKEKDAPARNPKTGAEDGPAPKNHGCIPVEEAMLAAMKSFIVKRDNSRTVIAGYPWFLDWGRDTLICLRGITSAGMIEESADILEQFAKYESQGTIPNMISGDDISNRDTSDAPLWFFTACSDIVKSGMPDFPDRKCAGRSISEILISIAGSYIKGTPNGIKMDESSGLIFSPSHFTWMDTNHPPGTPREGYPVEIQALWHAALVFLATLDSGGPWQKLAEQTQNSIERFFTVDAEELARDLALSLPHYRWYLGDCLHAAPGTRAEKARLDDALRPNQLFAITLDSIKNPALRESMLCACEELLVPGGIRSLADRPVRHKLPVLNNGKTLNDPSNPYWGKYKGDEDTRRKPAYHNGTVWTWPFPSYCEAMLKTRGLPARETALSILSSSIELLNAGCAGHLPEIMDGDIPHTQRGCGAQAWSVTELYRVWKLLGTS